MPIVIHGITCPSDKKIVFALRSIKGVGFFTARKILSSCNISEEIRTRDLDESDINKIRAYLEDGKILIEGQLNDFVSGCIRRLKDNGSRRGVRHSRGLPVRGQRTKTNARIRKGPRKSIANKKK